MSLLDRVRESRFLRDSFLLQISGALQAGIGLVSSAAIAHSIGEEGQSSYGITIAMYGLLFMLLNTGVVSAAVNQISAADKNGRPEKIASWLAYVAKVYGGVGVVLIAVGFLALPSVAEWRGYENAHQLGWMAAVLCTMSILETPRVVATVAFQGLRRMADLARLDVGTDLGRLAAILIGLAILREPAGAVYGHLVGGAIGSVIGTFMMRRASRADARVPGVRDIVWRVRDVPVAQGLPLALRAGSMRSMDALALEVLPPLLIQPAVAILDGVAAHVRVAQRVMKLPVTLLQGLSRTALPMLSRNMGERDPEKFRSQFLRVSAMGGLVVVLGIGLALLVLPIAVRVIYPDDYVEPVRRLCLIFAIGYAMQSFAVALDAFYFVSGKFRVAILISVLGLAVTVPLMAVLGERFPQTGVAWGVVASMSLCLVHYAYIGWYFLSGRYKTMFDEAPAAPPDPAVN